MSAKQYTRTILFLSGPKKGTVHCEVVDFEDIPERQSVKSDGSRYVVTYVDELTEGGGE